MADLVKLAGAIASLRDSLKGLSERVDDPDRDLLASRLRIRANEQQKLCAILIAAGDQRHVPEALVARLRTVADQVSIADAFDMAAVDAALAAAFDVLNQSGELIGES